MNDLTENINTVNNPQQAVSEFVGEQFIEWLMSFIVAQMRTWPVTLELSGIKTSQSKLKKFMLQRFLAEKALFGSKEGEPGFLRFAIANLSESDDPEAESALEILESKLETEAQNPKNDSWVNLLRALGATDEEIARTEPKEATRNFIAEVSDLLSSQDWQTAVGAFACFECMKIEESQILGKMLENNTEIKSKDLFFGAKIQAASNHLLDKASFDAEAKTLVWEGVKRQIQIHQDFLSGLVKYLEN